jgi:hypothetical protein
MTLFFVMMIGVAGAVVLISLFAPHKLPWYRPHLILNSSQFAVGTDVMPQQSSLLENFLIPEAPDEESLEIALEGKILKLETILTEKNLTIDKLQRQIAAEKSHRHEFEKIQEILNGEIKSLRVQNKELKVRIGEENE